MSTGGMNQNDNGMAPTYVAAGIVIVAFGLYWLFHDYIIYTIFMIRRFELMIIMLWSPNYALLMNWCNQVIQSTVTLKQLTYLTYNVADALNGVYWAIGIPMMLLLLFRHPSRKFRRKFSMASLAALIKKAFPSVCTPHRETVLQHPEKSFSQSLTPIEFLKINQLIENNEFNQFKLYRLLKQQLGSKWSKDQGISPDIYGLFAAFIAFIANQRDLGNRILVCLNKQYNRLSFITRHFNTRKLEHLIDESISKCIEHPIVKRSIHQHYYTSTLLAELLYQARLGGIISTATFLWLKAVDRTLWYGLNNVGRQTYFAEGVAISVHWQFEHAMSQKSVHPNFSQIIAAFKTEYQDKMAAEAKG